MTFNLITEEWLLCNDNKRYSLLSLVEEINNIKSIRVPNICGTEFDLYEYPCYLLLFTICSVALHYTPREKINIKYGFTEEQKNTVKEYLLMHKNRFDLFDEKYPFMQWSENEISSNLDKLGIEQKNVKWTEIDLFKTVPFFPSENSINNKEFIGIDINTTTTDKNEIFANLCADKSFLIKDFPYHLLYLNSIHGNPGAHGCSGISSQGQLFTFAYGDNIGQTILMNIYPYDANSSIVPIWERESPIDYFYDNDQQKDFNDLNSKNDGFQNEVAAFTFFPNNVVNIKSDDTIHINKILYPSYGKTLKSYINECQNIYIMNHDRHVLKVSSDQKPKIYTYREDTNIKALLSAILGNRMSNNINSICLNELLLNTRRYRELPNSLSARLYGRDWDVKSRIYKKIDNEGIKLENFLSEIESSDEIYEHLEELISFTDNWSKHIKKVCQTTYPNSNYQSYRNKELNMFIYNTMKRLLFKENGFFINYQQDKKEAMMVFKKHMQKQITEEFFRHNDFDIKIAVQAFYKNLPK